MYQTTRPPWNITKKPDYGDDLEHDEKILINHFYNCQETDKFLKIPNGILHIPICVNYRNQSEEFTVCFLKFDQLSVFIFYGT